MKKRIVILSLLAGITVLAEKKPNIVVLLADDMGYGELGCYGQEIIKTPTIDALAEQGVRFTDFYAGCSVCSPSRGVLMTGIHAGKATIRGNKAFVTVGGKWDRIALKKSEVTLAEMLKGAGYQTAFVGKWHLGIPEDVSTWACNRGFDFAVQEQWGPKPGGGVYDERYHLKNGNTEEIFHDYTKWSCLDEFRTEIALDYLDSEYDKEKPLFLFMSYRSPHAHEFFLSEYDNYKDEMRDGYRWPEIERRHASRISMLDQQIKRLLDKLEAMGELENTFILFASDNGPTVENHHDRFFFQSSGGLKGYKRDMYEGGVRVPGIAVWPAKGLKGKVTDHQATFYDVMPTFAEIAGIQPPEQTDGISFLPEVLGKEQPKHDHIYFEIIESPHDKAFRQATRMGKWKAVRYGVSGKVELYDLEKDLYETRNVAGEYPEILMRMKKILETESTTTPHYPMAGQPIKN
ncbi:sulfatase-like hydrolase/transferase [Pontiella agarivorans]|uniref:Sulfatase-like hydrolase/transferase n=1 Tax=Pontiella agarivorans TaxID=3038953 RepID=A0ABU5MW86_9BACT|nr:sulfatase-like hydrolase/transferase [Pontiella agarivorans]MDZ8118393.1 sulfatase-like hydrolase/transferase [Pontiella agarivorans]